MTNPHDIIKSWEACSPVLQRPSAWITLMRIAAEGQEGVRLTGKALKLPSGVDHRTINKWESAGLIRIDRPEQGIKTGFILSKGLRLLRLQS